MEPEIVIADEAVSVLDVSVQVQAQVLKLLDDVKRRFNLVITHDMCVGAQICDRIMVMEKGIVVEEGAMHRVYTAPQHPYTRALLDAAPGRNFAFRKAT
jgi:peptide/nickel transport system ATP-binding protein